MHTSMCVCAEIPTLTLATKVVLVQHHREVHKTTATGPVALLALPNHERHVHGLEGQPMALDHLAEVGRRVVVLFPSEDVPPLAVVDARPVTLIVPDGNWAQARRIANRVASLPFVERVGLPVGAPSTYQLRREEREGGLATMEAIARALGVLEGDAVEAALLKVFDAMVSRTLLTRQMRSVWA